MRGEYLRFFLYNESEKSEEMGTRENSEKKKGEIVPSSSRVGDTKEMMDPSNNSTLCALGSGFPSTYVPLMLHKDKINIYSIL